MGKSLRQDSGTGKAGRRPLRPPLLVMALCSLLAAGLAAGLGLTRASRALDAALADRFSITQHVLSSEIGRLRHLPRVIAEDARLRAALALPDDPEAIAVANSYLQRLRAVTEADEAYLIGADGRTLAASNWNESGSFVGADYGFRPYFRDALDRGEGQYYAIGVTTGRPGVFLSARIEALAPPAPSDLRPLGPAAPDPAPLGLPSGPLPPGPLANGAPSAPTQGVAVVKVSLDALEAAWARAGEIAAVTDPDGVVFLSALPQWRFRPLTALSPATEARLAAERRYDRLPAGPPLGLEGAHLRDPARGGLRLRQGPVTGTDWRLYVALPVAGIWVEAAVIGLLALGSGILASVFALTLSQRRQILRLQQEEARRLEGMVAARTRALAQEIDERRRTEAELRLAQRDLVQATKLAVLGRMSAAIVHEVGQSLSALDNNLAVSELHGRAGATERLAQALERSRRMVRRLQGVVGRLRSFGSRQVPVETGPVALAPVVAVAAEIVAPRARELGVALRLPEGALPLAQADAPRLEQVLANLMLNAIEAAAEGGAARGRSGQPGPAEAGQLGAGQPGTGLAGTQQPETGQPETGQPETGQAEAGLGGTGLGGTGPQVALAVICPAPGRLHLVIDDTGPGIAPARRSALLEPFTGDRPEGMGLGLYIVQNLLEQMGGRLHLGPAPGGGTRAAVELPRAPLAGASPTAAPHPEGAAP